MNSRICDHTSVGILVWHGDQLLLIERQNYPFGFAPPAGHVDNSGTFEAAAKRELFEEVGLKATNLKKVLEERKRNTCSRIEGVWHMWKIYEAEVENFELQRSEEETKTVGWYSKEKLGVLADRTKQLLAGNLSQTDFDQNPGIEPVWFEHFSKLKVIDEN